MSPYDPPNDSAGRNRRQAEAAPQFGTADAKQSEAPNFTNIGLDNFGLSIPGTAGHRSVTPFIVDVLQARPPAKIGKTIVGPIFTAMTTFVAYGRRALKGKKNETVDEMLNDTAIRVKSHDVIAGSGTNGRETTPRHAETFFPSRRSAIDTGPDRTIRTGCVAGKVWNGLVLYGSIELRHDSLLAAGCVEGRPESTNLWPPRLFYRLHAENQAGTR